VQVTIDPGLNGREGTRWARNLTVHERFDAMPPDAIPNESEVGDDRDDCGFLMVCFALVSSGMSS